MKGVVSGMGKGSHQPIATLPTWADTVAEEELAPPEIEDNEQTSPMGFPQGAVEGQQSPFPYAPEKNARISLWEGEHWKLECDAVVNACEEHYLDKKGLSGRFLADAGPKIIEELQRLTQDNVASHMACRTGDAVITKGYDLHCKYVMHTVGPRYNEKYRTAAENMLHSCYRVCLQLLLENKLETIAFPPIHSDKKNYTSDVAAPIVLRTLRRFIDRFPERVTKIVLCFTNQRDIDVYTRQMKLYFPRTKEEEEAARLLLPEDIGNELGETVRSERSIRINIAPDSTLCSPSASLKQCEWGLARGPGRHREGFRQVQQDCSSTVDAVMNGGRVAPISSMLLLGGLEEFTQMQYDFDAERRKNIRKLMQDEKERTQYSTFLKRSLNESLRDVEDAGIVYKAGKDREQRPIIAFVASKVESVAMIERALLYFVRLADPIVERDYVVIYFHYNAKHSPEITWLNKIHKMLPAKYHKNLKKLHIVHSTVWLNVMIGLLRATLSSSFISERLNIVDSTEQLNDSVPLDSIQLPDDILRFEMEKKGAKTPRGGIVAPMPNEEEGL